MMKTRQFPSWASRIFGGMRARNVFHSARYLRHNQQRQEHLAILGLDLSEQTVLEHGARIGDHTSLFLDRAPLAKLFEYVYVPRRQPRHEEFPVDWSPVSAAAWQ
jgi:hypothetical protein